MSLQGVHMLLLAACVSTVHPLTGPNVCITSRLVPSTDVYSSDYLESNCENLGFTTSSCQAARSNRISFSNLYLTQPVHVCCDGWIQDGDSCLACQDGWYGRNCSLSCQCLNDGTCDHVTGECNCTDGWTGMRCEERCSRDRYGPNCSLECRSTCKNGGVCHPSLGHCLCEYEWEGATCKTSCSAQACYMDSDSCSNGAPYDPTGHCICPSGWDGRYCTEPCPNNKYGAYCRKTCQCQNNGLCNWEDGSCLCPPGFTGRYCESTCPEGYYGQDCVLRCDCPYACDSVEGACLECPAGFAGPGCRDPCEESRWGMSCSQICDCIDSSPCDRFTGECDVQSTTVSQTTRHSTMALTSDPTSSTSSLKPFAIPENKVNPPTSGPAGKMSTFIIPLTVFVVLAIAVAALSVVAIRRPCRRKSAIRSEQPVFKLNHQYADCSASKDAESDYAEISDVNGGYEVPMIDALNKPGTINSRQPEVNYYKTPPVRAPSDGTPMDGRGQGSDVKVDNDGYLQLQDGRQQQPPEYQTIITPNKWNLR